MSGPKQSSRHTVNWFVAIALCLLLPAIMGGCPEYRNAVVGSIDAAMHAVLLTDAEEREALDGAINGIMDASLDLFFDQFRADETR